MFGSTKVYKGKTFCDERHCAKFGDECDKSLTDEVFKDAIYQWGAHDPPFMLFAERSFCYEEDKEN